MNELFKVGVIGAGSISETHLNAYKNNSEVELYAICDLNEQRAKAKADKFGISKVFTDYKKMLADPELQAVSVCTWNSTHAEISIAALEAGKNVLCEKPLCKTVEEANLVKKAVCQSDKMFQVGFVRRYASTTRILRQFIDAGDMGEIYFAKATCLRRCGNPGGWFSDKTRSGGGPLIDIGVHFIDLCWYLMGRPKLKSVSANMYKKLGNRSNIKNLSFYKAADYDAGKNDVEDLANALIRFENGASLMVDVSFTLHAKKSEELLVRLYGEKGGAEIEPELFIVSEKYDTILNQTPQVDHLSFSFADDFQTEINYFIDSSLGRKETLSPIESGVEMMQLLCAIYESAEKGIEIQFKTV